VWSNGPALAFVVVIVWCSFIRCQIFRETGPKGESGQPQYVFQKLMKELGREYKILVMYVKDLLTKNYVWK
jgi:hypothetical protein